MLKRKDNIVLKNITERNYFYRFLCLLFILSGLSYGQRIDTLKLDISNNTILFDLPAKKIDQEPNVGLALSGGGARGLTQLGLLKAFKENNIHINLITGTSMGSIIGGLYAAGYSIDCIDSLLTFVNWDSFFKIESMDRNKLFIDQKITEDKSIVSFRLDGFKPIFPTSLNSGHEVSNYLSTLSLNAPLNFISNFDNFKVRFKAISTDLVTGEKFVLDKGSLSLAMRASSSVTLLIPPIKKDNSLLVDGGLVENIPVTTLVDSEMDYIIASNATSNLRPLSELNFPWEIADQLVSIPMQILNKQHLKKADVVIESNLANIKNTDFNKAKKLIELGYNSAKLKIDEIQSGIKNSLLKNLQIYEYYINNLYPSDVSNNLESELVASLNKDEQISNLDIYYELYKLQKKGDYQSVWAEINNGGDSSFIKIHTQLNKKIKLTVENIYSPDSSKYISKLLYQLDGTVYNPYKVKEKLLKVLRYYRSRGYSFIEFERISYDEKTGNLFIKLSDGRVTGISISGNERTNKTVIQREFTVKPNSIFKIGEFSKGLTNLTSTNLFENVEIFFNSKYEINVKVFEKVSRVLRLGLRIDNENFTQASMDIREENLFGSGTELGTIISGGLRNRTFIVEHKSFRLFDSYISYKISGFYELNDVNVYRADSIKSKSKFSRSKFAEYRQVYFGASLGVGAQVEKVGAVGAELIFQKDQLLNIDNFNGPVGKIDLTRLKFHLIIDSQNKFPYPDKGYFIKGFYETSQKSLGADISYSKFLFDYSSYYSIENNHTLIPRFIIGFADKTLPLSQQFSFGGQESFFGYREYEYRGRQIFQTSFEYRYHLPFRVFFDSFLRIRYDLGSIWDNQEEIRFKDLKHGIGASLSIDTPIGPADFSIGRSFLFKKINNQSRVLWGPVLFYFTIGYYY